MKKRGSKKTAAEKSSEVGGAGGGKCVVMLGPKFARRKELRGFRKK